MMIGIRINRFWIIPSEGRRGPHFLGAKITNNR
jgi:hypothetical protein